MKHPGGFAVWQEPFTSLRVPKLFHLRMDPFERADIVSDQYNDWRCATTSSYASYARSRRTQAHFCRPSSTYPPSQEQASFSIDQIARDAAHCK